LADKDKQLSEYENQPVPLTRKERVGAWVVGGVFSIAGIVAILGLNRDGAGSLALVAVGALFLLVGVAEVIPSVFKLGSNEMTVRRTVAQAYTLRMVEEAQAKEAIGDTEGAKQTLESIANPPAPELALASHSVEAASMRLDATNYLMRWATRWNAVVTLYRGYPDFITVAWQDKQVIVHTHFLELGPEMVNRLTFAYPPSIGRPTAIVAVFNWSTWAYSTEIQQVVRMFQHMYDVPVRSVLWGAKDRYASLEMAIHDLLGIHLQADPPSDSADEPSG
jgi:hypothetical protein